MPENKQVLVAGYFDLFHSGHAKFLEQAASYGELSVLVGSDESSIVNKHKRPIYSQSERAYIVSRIKHVSKVYTPLDPSLTNFENFLSGKDFFIINEDGDMPEKRKVCEKHGVEYIVLKRQPEINTRQLSSSNIKESINLIPQRIDLVSFYDQKNINSLCEGSVILANIKPIDADFRSGLSSSTIEVIKRVFGPSLPKHLDRIELAKIIFAIENPPDREYVSGVVDQLGICLPGINRLHFHGDYFPYKIEKGTEKMVDFLNKFVYLKQTKPRPVGYHVYDGREKINYKNVSAISKLGDEAWQALHEKDIIALGDVINRTHVAQKTMIPGYESDYMKPIIEDIQSRHYGAKVMGAGGYGYIMVLSDNPDKDFIKINITKQ